MRPASLLLRSASTAVGCTASWSSIYHDAKRQPGRVGSSPRIAGVAAGKFQDSWNLRELHGAAACSAVIAPGDDAVRLQEDEAEPDKDDSDGARCR